MKNNETRRHKNQIQWKDKKAHLKSSEVTDEILPELRPSRHTWGGNSPAWALPEEALFLVLIDPASDISETRRSSHHSGFKEPSRIL